MDNLFRVSVSTRGIKPTMLHSVSLAYLSQGVHMIVMLLTCLIHVYGARFQENQYILALPSNCTYASDFSLAMTSLEEDEVNVTIKFPRRPDVDIINAATGYGQWTYVTLPPHVRLKDNTTQDNGIEVQATAPIGLHLMEPLQSGGKDTQILSTSMLNTHYIVQSYFNFLTNITTAVSIIALKNGTDISIGLKAAKDNASTVTVDDVAYHVGETISKRLDSCQTMLLSYGSDISSIDIKASEPIAVVYLQTDGVTLHAMNQLLPVSKWGNHFISFPISERPDTVIITAAEDGTNVCVTKNSQKTTFVLFGHVGLEVPLSSGDFMVIRSDKRVTVAQLTARGCKHENGYRRFSPISSLMILPSINGAVGRYLLSSPNRVRRQTIAINLVIRSQAVKDVRFNGIPLSSQDRRKLNLTFYGKAGHYNLYRLHQLVSSGEVEHEREKFLVMSETMSFIHAQSNFDRSTEDGTEGLGVYDFRNANATSDFISPSSTSRITVATPSSEVGTIVSTPAADGTNHSAGAVSLQAASKLPAAPSANGKQLFTLPSKRNPNDSPNNETQPSWHIIDLSSSRQPSGMKFAVKEAKTSNEINFHEAERRSARRKNGTERRGLDITVIAVIVSLASAIILVIVVVFGFFVAEFLSGKDQRTLLKISLMRYRAILNRGNTGDYGPLITDNVEMFSRDYDEATPS